MKTRFIAVLALLIFTITSNAQRKLTTDKLQVKNLPLGTKQDSVVVADGRGDFYHIPQSQLTPQISIPTLEEVLNSGNTTNSNLTINGYGDKIVLNSVLDNYTNILFNSGDTTGNMSINFSPTQDPRGAVSTLNFLYDGINMLSISNSETTFEGAPIIKDAFTLISMRDNGNTGTLRMQTAIQDNYTWFMPTKSGTVAFVNDNDYWRRLTGTPVTGDFKVEFGDYNELGNGTILSIDDLAGRFWFKEGVVSGSSITFPSYKIGPISGVTGGEIGPSGTIVMPIGGFTANRNIRLQDKDGTVAYLDDVPNINTNFYDEGTLTPVLVDQGSGATYSLTVESADYARSGNLVTVNIRINGINTTGTPTGFLRLDSSLFDSLPPVNLDVWSASVNTFKGGNVNFYSISSQFGHEGFFFEYQNALDSDNGSIMSSNTITNGTIHVSVTYKTNVYTP